ncbi:hypothetical protein CI109_106250 [Kwoniella shandongensis]|uniref:Uncharacterized protein n=1 Tax=Kwoniella shandongensis TaxID=1734106 RepID=A0A5M6BZT2_9TREE|nr:uncharacterized protein CI109_003853 [Kwoniella shandongensis]KAA5527881.1 hypothetical protein CI109_003853 [Kwoniella shandongensis]
MSGVSSTPAVVQDVPTLHTLDSIDKLKPVHYLILDLLKRNDPVTCLRLSRELYDELIPTIYEHPILITRADVDSLLYKHYRSAYNLGERTTKAFGNARVLHLSGRGAATYFGIELFSARNQAMRQWASKGGVWAEPFGLSFNHPFQSIEHIAVGWDAMEGMAESLRTFRQAEKIWKRNSLGRYSPSSYATSEEERDAEELDEVELWDGRGLWNVLADSGQFDFKHSSICIDLRSMSEGQLKPKYINAAVENLLTEIKLLRSPLQQLTFHVDDLSQLSPNLSVLNRSLTICFDIRKPVTGQGVLVGTWRYFLRSERSRRASTEPMMFSISPIKGLDEKLDEIEGNFKLDKSRERWKKFRKVLKDDQSCPCERKNAFARAREEGMSQIKQPK